MTRSLALAFFVCLSLGAPAWAQSKATVQCPVSVDVPVVVTLTGTDLVTTTQNLTINQSNIAFDAALTARGKTSVTWRGNTNSNNGFMVTVQRSVISGTGSGELQKDLRLSGSPVGGGDTDVQMLGAYGSGVALPDVSEGMAEPFCQTNRPGSANFTVDLDLNAPSQHGRGTVQTVLTFVGASL